MKDDREKYTKILMKIYKEREKMLTKQLKEIIKVEKDIKTEEVKEECESLKRSHYKELIDTELNIALVEEALKLFKRVV